MNGMVTVYLDDNELECMDGAVRCGLVVWEDEEGEERVEQGLMDNSGFWSIAELVSEVAGILRVRPDAVLVAA